MSRSSTLDAVENKQGLIAKIENIFGLGYATKEDLRELDKKLRDNYYADFKALRHRWEEIYLTALNVGQKSAGDEFKKVIQAIDRVAEKINRADYGYAGLLDRKGHMREGELARVFDYDKALTADVQGIAAAISELYIDSETDKWTDALVKVKKIKLQVLDFETKWNNREREFRPMEV